MRSEDSNTTVGLPCGLAEQLVKHTFCKWKPNSEYLYESQDIPAVVEETVIADTFVENSGEIKDDVININPQVLETPNMFTNSEAYNGAIFNDYCWSQTITDVEITIRIPENVIKKSIRVEILPLRLVVKVNNESLFRGELCHKCKANDAIWSIDKQKLVIHLDKCQEIWWNFLTKDEPELDISKIDCSRPYEELSDEAQAKIQELQWNQDRKRLGLSTSDELMMHDTLKKAWNAEGTPFSGLYDPSIVTFR